MTHYIGIDLGTTNSVICSYDGVDTRIWKSPEQNDVTPSVIYIDRRGNKYLGKRAYDAAPHNESYAAALFKRVMGTSTPVTFSGLTKTPEECSAEILQLLFSYLPEEVRTAEDTATVITVPAAFNQMQKEATLQAAQLAGLGRVALMQEPVAAVMSVMRSRNSNGQFLIYDFGGGTLDIAIAESLGGRVNLLVNDGLAMCGGRDFDRQLFDNIVRPWLQQHFTLPDDFAINPQYKALKALALWATEKAKIDLSSRESSNISLSEAETRVTDLDGNEIYLDITVTREEYNRLIERQIADTIDATRAALAKAGLNPQDIERLVFVGGPTHYKPLRDKICFELGIPGSTDVNPMTAVAEGASLFAESIDWTSETHGRKSSRGQISAGGELSLSFNYIARTQESTARVALRLKGEVSPGTEFQIDSLDSGWTSGRLPVAQGTMIELPLGRAGDNHFKAFVFNATGPVLLEEDRIVIARTAATVDAIPASHSISIEVLEKLGGQPVLDSLVRAGDALPHKGKKIYKAAQALQAGALASLNFKVWEGEIEDPIDDNRLVGVLTISGSDFDDGTIPAGATLECDYEILDSGTIRLEISVPSIASTFNSGKNFYSTQEGQRDFTQAAAFILDEATQTLNRLESIAGKVDSDELDKAREKLESALTLQPDESDSEQSQHAWENVLAARKLIARVRKAHLKAFHQAELDRVNEFFEQSIRELARPSEISAFEALSNTASRNAGNGDRNFEQQLEELKGRNFEVLWRQDWFVVAQFKWLAESPHLFNDHARFNELSAQGSGCLQRDDISQLRRVVADLTAIRAIGNSEQNLAEMANIVRG